MNYVEDVLLKLIDLNLGPELTDLYALLVLVKGENTTLEDVHDAWAVWKNRIVPGHKSLIRFDGLTEEVQELDRPYKNAIVEAAAAL